MKVVVVGLVVIVVLSLFGAVFCYYMGKIESENIYRPDCGHACRRKNGDDTH